MALTRPSLIFFGGIFGSLGRRLLEKVDQDTDTRDAGVLSRAHFEPQSLVGLGEQCRSQPLSKCNPKTLDYGLQTLFGSSTAVEGAYTYDDESKQCGVYVGRGLDHAAAQAMALSCCEKLSKGETCKLMGGSDPCARRKADGPGWGGGENCTCPSAAPHLLTGGSSLFRRLPGAPPVSFAPDHNGVCVDECFASEMDGLWSSSDQAPTIDTPAEHTTWPVVFLAVYKLGSGIVHSNLAFCPSTNVLKDPILKERVGHCSEPGSDGGFFCSREHGSTWAQGNDVPILLQRHGCRELIWDGNSGATVWMPKPHQTGCWAQGMSPKQFLWKAEVSGRSGLGYQKLFWLTSDNSVAPFSARSSPEAERPWSIWPFGQKETPATPQQHAKELPLEEEMQQCFGSRLGNRLDFNPGTYSLLHHNCNKFSSECMRYLGLPRWYSSDDKGLHDEIAFSATEEESGSRSVLSKPTKALFGEVARRPPVSRKCQSTTMTNGFHAATKNCRRVGLWASNKGDCPRPDSRDLAGSFRCYDADASKQLGAATAGFVGYEDPVNGKCAVREGEACTPRQGRPWAMPCRPGTQCKRKSGTQVYKCERA